MLSACKLFDEGKHKMGLLSIHYFCILFLKLCKRAVYS